MSQPNRIELPRWALFLLYAQCLVQTPVFIVPWFLVTLVAFAAFGVSIELLASTVAAAVVILPIVAISTTSAMTRDGVLEVYLAAVARSTRFGRYLLKRFGQTEDSA